MTQATNDGDTPLHAAANDGNLSLLKQRLDLGDAVNAKNKAGKTPLDLADENGHTEVAIELSQRGGLFGNEC
jgi:ankyrin repeat protein